MATILVVDDEPAIRQLTVRILERAGHSVLAFGDGTAAMAVTDPFDLLVVDYILPDMNGVDVTKHFRQTLPSLPVVLMSGYLPNPDMTPAPPAMFLQKPMRPAEITAAVEQMLASQ